MLLLSKATFSGIFQISIVFDQQFINLDVPLLTNTWNLLSILTHRKKHIQLFQKYIDTLFHTHYEKSIDLSHYWMCLFYSRVTVCVANIPLQWFCISIGNNREFLKKFKKKQKQMKELSTEAATGGVSYKWCSPRFCNISNKTSVPVSLS